MKYPIVVLLATLGSQVAAWNGMGHRVIAQIAVDQMSQDTVKKLNRLNHEMDIVYPPRKLVNAATWMDEIRFEDNNWYTAYHYQDYYISIDGTPTPKQTGYHAIWAINTAIETLKNPKTRRFNKAMALRVLLHVVGDIHQPLHTVSLVSKQNPQGNLGGNLYPIESNSIGSSLHRYWDNGGGYFLRPYPVRYKQVVNLARQLEKQYPCKKMPVGSISPDSWVASSRKVAIEKAYAKLDGKKLPNGYQAMTQDTSKYQVALAGCRLAMILKQVDIAY